MTPFSLLLKPASADCNLRCPYCFYAGKHPSATARRMSREVLDRVISSYLATEQPQYVFGWQGGEPTLLGVDFFRAVTELQQRHGRAGAVVSNGLQTNGTLIDDALAEHLRAYNFLVGVSLDGPAEVHDFYRRDAAGGGSHAAVLGGVACLRRHGVEHNALTLVTPANVGRAAEIFSYLAEQGFFYQQYIPCVEFDGRGAPLPWTISGEQWGEFLCALFQEWRRGGVEVRLFEALLARLLRQPAPLCHLGNNCCQYFVVEYNGDVYPCDFFVTPETRLGKVGEDSWEALQQSPAYREFGAAKAQWSERCSDCGYQQWCAGDCLKHRYRNGADPRALSWLCAGWRQFYRTCLPELRALADRLRPPAGPLAAVGRNDLCPCGSGRKYKRCCGRAGGESEFA